MRYRSNNGYGVPMTIRAPYGGGVHGALYHSQSVEAFFTHVPGLKVVVPVDPVRRARACSARRSATTTRSSSSSTRRCTAPCAARSPTRDYTVPLGQGRRSPIPGSQVTVVAYGLMAHYALEAADRVARGRDQRRGRRPAHAPPARHARRVLDSVRKTGKCLIVYEDNRFGGYGAEVAAIVAEEAFDYLDGPVTRIAGPGRPGRAVQPRARGLVHGQPGEDRRRDPEARRVLSAPRSTSMGSTAPFGRSCSRIDPGSSHRRTVPTAWSSRSPGSRASPGATLPASGAANAT